MKTADRITAIVMLVFSIIVAVASWRMPQGAEFGPGVGFLPFWLGVVMAVLSATLLIQTAAGPARPGPRPFPASQALLNVGLVLAGLAAYIAVLNLLGFIVSTLFFITFLLGVVEKERWLKSAWVSLVATGALYVVFQILLDVKLPRSVLGF